MAKWQGSRACQLAGPDVVLLLGTGIAGVIVWNETLGAGEARIHFGGKVMPVLASAADDEDLGNGLWVAVCLCLLGSSL